MEDKTILLKRGEESNRLNYTPKLGEPIYTIDEGKLYIGDGETVGGISTSSLFFGTEFPTKYIPPFFWRTDLEDFFVYHTEARNWIQMVLTTSSERHSHPNLTVLNKIPDDSTAQIGCALVTSDNGTLKWLSVEGSVHSHSNMTVLNMIGTPSSNGQYLMYNGTTLVWTSTGATNHTNRATLDMIPTPSGSGNALTYNGTTLVWSTNSDISHTNRTVLDKIPSAVTSANSGMVLSVDASGNLLWNYSTSVLTHDNKSTLDKIPAFNASYSGYVLSLTTTGMAWVQRDLLHSNRATLDNIPIPASDQTGYALTVSNTTGSLVWSTGLSHTNRTTLDRIPDSSTASVGMSLVVTSSTTLAWQTITVHSHTNKTTLDKIPDDSTAEVNAVLTKQSDGNLSWKLITSDKYYSNTTGSTKYQLPAIGSTNDLKTLVFICDVSNSNIYINPSGTDKIMNVNQALQASNSSEVTRSIKLIALNATKNWIIVGGINTWSHVSSIPVGMTTVTVSFD